ncbi:PCL1 [Candida pseudojiufengensis]|uniref:PCL1 n=1 Tax=Candida pseudojiufengensis TaxID=497109 RepID=UPI002225B544|nr:PCL1 [Candida pseudojiufengensis]KAI5964310.1 PCL1 [Candida pseudojiufengensis]
MVSSIDLQALNIFLNGPITHDMIHKLVVATLQVIPCKDTKTQTYTTTNNTIKQLPSLMTFLTKLIKYTNVYTGTLMATLIYLKKLQLKLPKNAQGLPCTRHRILLSCLILSSKFHNDSSPKNKHWAKYTDGLFNVKDINLMERQLIYLLNWDLKVSNDEMIESLGSFLDPIKNQILKQEKIKIWKRQQQIELQSQNQALQQQRQRDQNQKLSLSSYSPSTSSVISSVSSTSSTTSSNPPTRNNSFNNNNNNKENPLYNQLHYRQDSTSSINSMNSMDSNYSLNSLTTSISSNSLSTHSNIAKKIDNFKVDPIIEFTAMKEEIELNELLKKFNNSSIKV